MKKIFAMLISLAMVFTVAAAAAEEAAFTFPNGEASGMTMDEVIALVPSSYYEIDREHTRGPVTFTDLEYEHTSVEGHPADVHYLFVDDKLVAIRVCFEDGAMGYDQVKADLTGRHGEAAALDLSVLGNGIYAVDDDGRPEGRAEAIVSGNLMIVLERDEDDVDVTFVDLSAAYIAN